VTRTLNDKTVNCTNSVDVTMRYK